MPSLVRIGKTPLLVASLVLLVYGAWLVADFWSGHDPRDFVIVSTSYVTRCGDSSVIRLDSQYHNYVTNGPGYDGQFYYFMALDPGHARCYMDIAPYRYSRIFYPIVARVLGLAQPGLIPWAMIFVNLAAIVGGTLALAMWLRRKSVSPWVALIYGFYPGLFTGLWRDLTEPLSYGLVALAIYLFDFGGKRRVLWAAICFGLALLTRETAVLFSVVYGMSLLLSRDWRRAAYFLAISLLPLGAYKLFIRLWMGDSALLGPEKVPFAGLTQYWPWHVEQVDLALTVALPALLMATIGIWGLLRRTWSIETSSLLLNVLILVVLLPGFQWVEYFATGRATTGVILAALLCVPLFDRLSKQGRGWLWVSSALWFLPWYALIPSAFTWIGPSF